jgi:hypothetical protein
LEFRSYLVYKSRCKYFHIRGRHLGFLTSGYVGQYSHEPNGKLDPENIDVAVGISLIPCLEAEIHAFEVQRPPSWIFPLPVRSHSILMSPNGKLDPENIGVAVGIPLISCLEAKIHTIEVQRPPS